MLLLSFSSARTQDSTVASGSSPAAANEITKIGKVEIPPEKRRPVNIPKVTSNIVVDGKVDEALWRDAAVFKDFYQTNPGDNTAASKPTEVYMMYDEYNLYIAFKCWDEKDKIRATVAKRDNVFNEDNVRVWLDTYNDQKRAYVIGFNPLGVQQDGIFTEGQGADFSVDIVMESKGVIEDWGWSVEVKIPFKSLRYSAGNGKLWGFNAARNIDRLNDEFDQWLPDDRNVSGFLVKHGKISGLDGIKFEKTLEIVPSITVSETGRRERTIPRYLLTGNSVDPGRFVNHPLKTDIGVTLKYTLTPSITLDAAYNPDFAEIEADAAVVTANQRFPIYFEEKRPFFLEGADIFRSPLQVFYSRNIVDPDLALKLSGKQGKTSFGFLTAIDKAPGNYEEDDRLDPSVRPRIDEFIDKKAMFAVVRLKRDVGKQNNIGFFGTYRAFPEQKNLVGGFDGRFKFSPKMTSQFQVVGSHTRRCTFDPEFEPTLNVVQALSNLRTCGTGRFTESQLQNAQTNGLLNNGNAFNSYRTGNGIGYYANLDYSTETHGWFAEVGGRSKFYPADSGFTRRGNANFSFFYNRVSTKSDAKKKIIRAQWAQFTGVDYDWTGRLIQYNVGSNLNLTLQKNTYLFAETGTSYEKLYEEEFGLKRSPTRPLGTFFGEPNRAVWQQYVSTNINQVVNKRFNYGAFVGMIRNNYDYFFYEPNGLQNPGPGFQFDANIYMEFKPTDPLRMSISYNKSRLVRNDNKVRSFDADVISARSTYQFSRFTFARFRLDYNSMEKGFGGQALFGWNPNPGTAFYVGYNDSFNYGGRSPFTGQLVPGFERNSRTFFIRASYLFRKSF